VVRHRSLALLERRLLRQREGGSENRVYVRGKGDMAAQVEKGTYLTEEDGMGDSAKPTVGSKEKPSLISGKKASTSRLPEGETQLFSHQKGRLGRITKEGRRKPRPGAHID